MKKMLAMLLAVLTLCFGAAAMAEGLIARIKRELDCEDATVIATGGLARVVAEATDAFDHVDPQLTIKGICEIYRRLA